MDLGPQWPFWLADAWALLGILLLVWAAWRHAGAVRGWRAGVLGLLFWWCIAVLPLWQEAFFCTATGIDLPGCDWEFHRARTDLRSVLARVFVGGTFQTLRLGAPVAALVFSIRLARLLPRGRRGTTHPPSAR